ncbi:MAG: thioesterase family protein [Desulfurococcaceae archaeon]|nr:thioesterase family protein [Desulfurococcaceae archaeon]
MSESWSLQVGLTCSDEYTVTEEYTAKHISSELPVLATPAMILFMERTSMRCAQQYLSEPYTTVGVSVNVRHLNPAPIGGVVRVVSRLINVEGRRLVFEVKAYYRDVLVGEGVHERFIVNRVKFTEKVKSILRD